MTDSMNGGAERGELILPVDESAIAEEQREMVSEPAKVMRVGSMIMKFDRPNSTSHQEFACVRFTTPQSTNLVRRFRPTFATS
jgi:hypothetical protein